MVKRKDEERSKVPGGLAAERLRQFEIQRGLPSDEPQRPQPARDPADRRTPDKDDGGNGA